MSYVGMCLPQEKINYLTKYSATALKLPAGSHAHVGGRGVTLTEDLFATNANLDTGNLTANTLYYVYLVLNNETPKLVLSLSAVAPTGYLSFRLLEDVNTADDSAFITWSDVVPVTVLTHTQVNSLAGNQGLGVFSAGSYIYQRIANQLAIRGKLTCGTTTSAVIMIPFPLALVSADNSIIPSLYHSLDVHKTSQQATNYTALISPSVGYFSLGMYAVGTPNSLTPSTGTAMMENGAVISFNLTVPIQSWLAKSVRS